MIKISRTENSIAFGTNVWKKLRQHIPNMRQLGYTVKLTDKKYATVKEYLDQRYVMFVQVQASGYKRIINIKDEAWAELLNALPEIDRVIIPADVFVCPDCATMKKVVKVDKDKRVQKTRLTQQQLKEIKEANAEAYGLGPVQYDMEWTCEFCGVHPAHVFEMPECLHCHAYDCKDCEPENFCKTCGDNMIIAV